MHIINLRRQSGAGVLALFDIRLSPDVELMDWRLKKSPAGELRTFPPQVRDTRASAVRIAPEIYDQITALAVATYQGQVASNDRNQD